jgi:hypothetical protein
VSQPAAPLAAGLRTATPPLACQPPVRHHLPPVPVPPSSSSSSTTSSTSSASSSPPPFAAGDHYQQTELGGAKARRGGWSGRHHVRTAAQPYSRDSSSNSSGPAEPEPPPQKLLLKAGGNPTGGGKSIYPDGLAAVDPDLSQSEMEEVLQLLRSRASPTGPAATRRPSLKDDHYQPPCFPSPDLLLGFQQEKSRRPSLDEIFDPYGKGEKSAKILHCFLCQVEGSADKHVFPLGRKSFPPQVAQVYRAEVSSPSPSGKKFIYRKFFL